MAKKRNGNGQPRSKRRLRISFYNMFKIFNKITNVNNKNLKKKWFEVFCFVFLRQVTGLGFGSVHLS